ncbi:MAG: hypothetical protein JNL74_19385 [Fibrobacteres bacterium]|nr:hypothetical protein [Fibrobacterota bacterium]
MHTLTLAVDSRKRICLSRLFDIDNVSSVRAYRKDDKIILEPMVEIPAHEAWLYKNKESLNKVKQGLEQKGSIKRGSFSKHVSHDI